MTTIQRTATIAALLLLNAGLASAHSFPQKESPAAGAALPIAPPDVSIRFDAPIEPLFAQLQVIAPDGKNAALSIRKSAPTDTRSQCRCRSWDRGITRSNGQWSVLIPITPVALTNSPSIEAVVELGAGLICVAGASGATVSFRHGGFRPEPRFQYRGAT